MTIYYFIVYPVPCRYLYGGVKTTIRITIRITITKIMCAVWVFCVRVREFACERVTLGFKGVIIVIMMTITITTTIMCVV